MSDRGHQVIKRHQSTMSDVTITLLINTVSVYFNYKNITKPTQVKLILLGVYFSLFSVILYRSQSNGISHFCWFSGCGKSFFQINISHYLLNAV